MSDATSLLFQSFALGASIISLIVSGAALFFARFRPFTPDLAFGQLALGNTEIDSQQGRQQLVQCLLLCEVHNSGARSGVIEDIAISLSPIHGKRIVFFPHCFIKHNYVVEGLVKIEVERPWSPVFVPPHGHVNHTIWFLNMHPTERHSTLTEGNYRYVVKYRKLGNVNWVKALDRPLTLDATNVSHINAKIGNLHMPDTGYSAERDKLLYRQN